MDKVMAIIEYQGKILIGKVKAKKVKDFGGIEYVFPGGSVEENETLEQAVTREAKEETGLDVTVIKQISFRVHPVTKKNIYYFHCKANSDKTKIDPTVNDDLESLLWVERSEVQKYMPTIFPNVNKYLLYKPYLIPVSAKGIVFDDGKIWLRKNERNEWELPGGKIDEGEQPEEAVAREMEEELGFTVKVKEIIHAYLYVIKISMDESKGVLVLSYSCELLKKSGKFETTGEAGTAKFEKFSLEEIEKLNMPDFYKEAIRKVAK